MLFKLTHEEICDLKNQHTHAFCALVALCRKNGMIHEPQYPSIKYANVADSWVEFYRCFHESRVKHFANVMRPKYKGGKEYMRIT